MSEYRYEARDLRTGTRLGDLPLGDVIIDHTLNNNGLRGTFQATLLLEQRTAPTRELIPTVPGHVSFPGDNGNVLLVPHQPEWQLDGDVTLLVEVRVPVWGSGNIDVLLAQRASSGTVAWWDIRLTAAGGLQIVMNEGLGGSNLSMTLGSAAEMTAVPAGDWVTLAVVVRPNVAGLRRVRAYWSTDGMQTWTPISGVKGGTAFSIPADQPLSIGAYSTATNGLVGDVRHVSFRRGSDGDLPGGTEVFRLDGTEIVDPDAATVTASTGQTVTVQRGGTPLTLTPMIPWRWGATIPGHRLTQGFLDGTLCARTVIWVYRDGVPIDGFIIWPRARRIGSRKAEIRGASLLSYTHRRRLAVTKSYTGVDQGQIARDLIVYMQSIPGGSIGIQTPSQITGVLRDRQPLAYGYERKNIGELLDQLSAVEGGFEFSVDVGLVADVPVATFRVWYPRRGRRYSDTGILLFRAGDMSGNLLDYELDEDASDMVTTVHMIGAGEAEAMLLSTQSNTALIDQGYPVLEETVSYKDITQKATLDSHGRQYVREHGRVAQRWRLRVDPDNESTRFGSWIVGDEVRVSIADDERFPAGPNGEPGFDGILRIVGQTVEVRNDGGPDMVTLAAEVPL